MPAFELLTGSMMSANPGGGPGLGLVIHYVVLGTVVCPFRLNLAHAEAPTIGPQRESVRTRPSADVGPRQCEISYKVRPFG